MLLSGIHALEEAGSDSNRQGAKKIINKLHFLGLTNAL